MNEALGQRRSLGTRSRHYLLDFVVVLILLAFLPPLSQGAGDKSGGTLSFGAENEFAGFDVIKASGFAICDAVVMNTVMERLFDVDDAGDLIPALAISAKPSKDGQLWNISLRQGVIFHDGTPFDADAVVQHWSRMLNPANRFRGRSFFEPIQAVSKVDAFTVQFQLAHAWPPFPKILSDTRGLSMSIPSPKSVEEDNQLRAPVGTGPFIFKEWVSGDRLVVKKNPHYWRKDRPHLDEIVFKIMPDHQTRFVSLKSGQMDLIWMDRGTIIDQAEKDAGLVLYQGEGNGAEIFVLNTAKPPFDDPRVRRAIAHAWNQEACVAMSYKNAIPMALHPFGQDIDCQDSDYPGYDPKEAKRLIDEYGKTVEIECLHSNTKRGSEQGELLQRFCKEIGVVVKPVGLSFGPVIKKVITKDYQISTWRMPSATDMGPLLFGAFHSQSRSNVSGYSNPAVDDLLTAQRMEMDVQKRNRMLCDIAGFINRDVPIIYRGGRRFHVIAKPEVKGIPAIRNGVVQLSAAWFEK